MIGRVLLLFGGPAQFAYNLNRLGGWRGNSVTGLKDFFQSRILWDAEDM